MNIRETVHTIVATGSLLAIAVGAWWVSPPAALIVVGSLLLSGVIYARTATHHRGKK